MNKCKYIYSRNKNERTEVFKYIKEPLRHKPRQHQSNEANRHQNNEANVGATWTKTPI